MTTFVLLALLLAVSASLVLALAVRRPSGRTIDRVAINVALYREREAELAADCAAGRIDEARRDALLAELRQLLVDDVEGGSGAVDVPETAANRHSDRIVPWLLLVCVPAVSFGLYFATGADERVRAWLELESRAGEVAALSRPLTAESVAKQGLSLADAARITQAGLGRRPADAEAWLQLGFTWLDLRAVEPGIESIRQAHRLAPERVDFSLALARVLIAVNGGRLDDESRLLFEDVLAREPQHQGALMFYGIAAYESGEFALAAKRWGDLLAMLDPASEGARLLRASIERAGSQVRQAAATKPLRVRVEIDPAVGELPADATLFVVARVAGGPPMPVAVRRLPAGALPADTELSDRDLLAPGSPLASRGPLEVSARVSLSGNAMPASGDIGSEPVRVEQPAKAVINLRLDRRLP